MRIRSVEPIPVSYPEPNDAGAMRHLCLVRVVTDDGVVGWGESITQWPEASLATREIVNGLAPLVVGWEIDRAEEVWDQLVRHTWWYGWRGGIAANAIAATDIAIWDALGTTSGASLLEMLGGPAQHRLPAVASCHAFRPEIEDLVAEMASWVAAGYQGVKVGFGKRGESRLGYGHERDIEFVARLRAALGDAAAIMVDLGVSVYWDVETAVRRVRAFEESRVDWVEEPLGPWDPDGYRRLRAATGTRIAYGEREWDVRGYADVVATGTVDVVGVDPGRAYGITGFRRVAEVVEQAGLQLNAHAWSSAIVTAASLACSLASPAAGVFEFKPLRGPMQHELVRNPIGPVGGWAVPLDGPGLGIEVVDEVVDRYRTG